MKPIREEKWLARTETHCLLLKRHSRPPRSYKHDTVLAGVEVDKVSGKRGVMLKVLRSWIGGEVLVILQGVRSRWRDTRPYRGRHTESRCGGLRGKKGCEGYE
jgi:hypothetical protein